MSNSSHDEMARYMKGVTVNENGLGPEQEKKLSRLIKHSNNQKTKDKAISDFVEGNLGLVVKCAGDIFHSSHSRLSMMDLVTEGNYWLLRCVRRFSYTKDCRFSTYAYPIIRHHLWQLTWTNRLIHVPQNVLEYRKRFRELQFKHHGNVTKEIIMQEFDVLADRAEDISGAFRTWTVASLDNPIGEESDATLGDMIEDETAPNPAVEADKNMLKEYLDKVGDSCLNPREKEIINLLYVDYHHYTLEQVAAKQHITRERIRQIAARGIRKMRFKVMAEWDSRHHEDRIDKQQVYQDVVGTDDYVRTYQMRQERDVNFRRKIDELNVKKQQKILNDLTV